MLVEDRSSLRLIGIRWRPAEGVGDRGSRRVRMQAQTAAVIAGECSVAIQRDIQRVDEAVIFVDVRSGRLCYEDLAVANALVDLLVAEWQLLVGIRTERCSAEDIDRPSSLKVGQRTETGV